MASVGAFGRTCPVIGPLPNQRVKDMSHITVVLAPVIGPLPT